MYDQWQRPDENEIAKEWQLEYVNKELSAYCAGAYDYFPHFKEAIEKAEIVEITKDRDWKIGYRSHTTTKEQLINLIKNYRSYPIYRNEQTIQNLYDRFENNEPMDMPIVLRFPNGHERIMGGNTRMDVAFQLGINPKVLMVKVVYPKWEEFDAFEENI